MGRGYWGGIRRQYQPISGALQREATTEVAIQDKEIRHSRVPMPPPRTIGRAPSGRVQSPSRREKMGRERRDARMEDTLCQTRKKRKGP